MRSLTLAAIDVGTNSVKGLVATKDFRTGTVGLLGQSQRFCFGVRNGEVVRPEQVSSSIEKVKEDLNKKAGLKIRDVLVSINGSHLYSLPSQGLVSVSRADQKISGEDIQRVLRAAQAVNLPSNKEVLDVLPKEFIVDGEASIKEPLGLQGIRLEAKVILACLFSPVLENLEKAFAQAGLSIIDVVVAPLATSRAVLTQEQKELGVMLVELGAGTTSLAIFEKGDLVDFAIFPVGSSNITNDIAIGLRTEVQTAERIKKEFATLKTSKGTADRELKKRRARSAKTDKRPTLGDKVCLPEKSLNFSKKFLARIVEARVVETFSQVQKALKRISGDVLLPSGIVLTGGGSALPGLVEYTKQRFKLPCRLGNIREINGVDNPEFANVAGLLLIGFAIKDEEKSEGLSGGFSEKIKRIFRAFLP